VYVVDDVPELTEMYRMVLEDSGFEVRTFNDRTEALKAFRVADPRPGLLITDYLGYPISAEQLMDECRRVEPGLKILMATACVEGSLRFVGARPDRFLQKPFGIDQLMAEVKLLSGFVAR
jgi:two-component system, OmpR family, response regulator